MHSRSNSLENISEVNSSQMQAQAQQGESKSDEPTTSFQHSSRSCHRGPPENRSTVHQKHMTFCWGQTNNKNSKLTEQPTSLGNNKDLSHDDLLLLLSLLEGELQARDEVITLLRADKIDLPLLEAHYGFVKPHKVLQSLQRDTVQGKGHGWQEDIYEKPITELDKLVEKQQKAYTHMLEQLLLVEQAHKQTLYRLEDEKRNHSEYMKKSDDFTNLLEQERERLKLLNDQEKAYQKQKEEENKKKVTNLEDELTKLKSFALLVIDEQQCVTDQLVQETAKVQELQAAARVAQEELNLAQTRLQEMESKVMYLEAELHEQSVQFHKKQEAMCTKLTDENSQNRHLRQKLSTLCQELDDLEESNKALHKTEKDLQERRDRTSNGECGDSSLVSEVEELRKRVVEMKGKDEELIKMENLCRDLKRKLERESIQNHSLKAEVDKLSHRIIEFEKLEDAFGKSKEECSMLKCNLEKEMTVTKQMCSDLDILRVRVKELETAKALLDKTEWTLKDDLTKLKTLTVMLVDERKTMSEKLKQLENKVQNSADKLQGERDKVISVTEKLIEESKKALKIKVEMEEKNCIVINERDDLKTKLKAEEEKNNAFQSKVSMMKRRLQSLEAVEREFLRNKAKKENMKGSIQNGLQQEDNKVKDLIQEVEWLRKKRKEMKAGENDIPKTQNVGECLEEKYSKEKALKDELDITQRELSKYQLVEKEHFNQEHILYKKLKEEEAKSSHLTKEVEALKEKIHTYMGIEESMCNMKTKYATLQRKQTQQEVRNKELARETESLTKELERYRRFSKSLRPGMIGRRFSDLQVSTKEVQTEPTESITSTYKNTDLLEQALVNGKMYDYSNQQNKPNCNATNPLSPSLNNRISHQNNTKQIINPNPNLKHIDKQQFINCKVQTTQNRTHNQQGDVLVTHIPNHLHIEVTPDQSHGTSPATRNTQTYTTIAVIPTRSCTTKQQSATVQNAPVSSHNKRCPSTDCHLTPGQSMSPISTTAYSQTVIHEFTSLLTTESAIASTEITITEGVPEGAEETEVTAAMLCVTPQKQNNQHGHMYNSSIPSVNTNEDNRMHNHLGIPDIQTINSNAETPSLCFCPGQEQRTLQGTSGTPAKVNSKTLSSIRIKPVSTSIPQPSQITVSTEEFQQSGPTRIPKPKACSMSTGTNSRVALIQNTGTAQSPSSWRKTYTVT